MISANAHRIRFANGEDADALRRLTERDSRQPLAGRVLIGRIDGTPAAALSLDEGRVIADSSRRTDHVVAVLRMRAGAIRAYEATPSLPGRLRAAFAAYRARSIVAPASLSRDGHADHEPMRVAA